MFSKKVVSVLALSAVSTLASANTSGQVEWSRMVPSICGIAINDSTAEISFKDEGRAEPSKFTITSNTSTGHGRENGAYVSIRIDSQSDNLKDITANDTYVEIEGGKIRKSQSIERWNGNGNTFIPQGSYDSYLSIDEELKNIDSGMATMTTTITVSCEK